MTEEGVRHIATSNTLHGDPANINPATRRQGHIDYFMSEWGEYQPEELREIVERLNEAEIRNTKLLGNQLEPSLLQYHPGKPSIGPLPRYIPTKCSKVTEPPIVFGPPERVKPCRRDRLNRTKRQLALVESLIETEGPSEQLNKRKAELIENIRNIRKEKHYKRNNNKRINK